MDVIFLLNYFILNVSWRLEVYALLSGCKKTYFYMNIVFNIKRVEMGRVTFM